MAREIALIDLLAGRGSKDEYWNNRLEQVNKIYVPITFGGEEVKTFDRNDVLQSDHVNTTQLKNIDILIRLESSKNFRVGVVLQTLQDGSFNNTSFFDWNTEEWLYSNVTSGGSFYGGGEIVLRKLAPSQMFLLGTHIYGTWLKDFSGQGIRLRMAHVSDLGDNVATIQAWVVGEKHV